MELLWSAWMWEDRVEEIRTSWRLVVTGHAHTLFRIALYSYFAFACMIRFIVYRAVATIRDYPLVSLSLVCGLTPSESTAANRGGRDLEQALKKYQNEVRDVYSTCVVAETIDERPSAYKDSDVIMNALNPTAVIVTIAKTVLNVKGF